MSFMIDFLARWKTRFLLVLPIFGVIFSSTAYVAAATVTTNNASQSGNNGLQISPTRTDLALNPGEATTFQISVKNVSSIALVAKATLNDFESDNTTGTPKLIINPSQHSPRSIQSFLKGVTDIPLQPGQTKNAQLTLDVPKDTAPGGYYGAVRYSAVPVNPSENKGPSQVSLTASVASLVLMEVNGPVNETLTLDSVNAQRHNNPSTFFFGQGPDSIAIRLTNRGNGFSQPIGHIYISKGGKNLYDYEFNTSTSGLHSTILPNTSRVFTDKIKNTSSFGSYKISATIAYKQGDEAITVVQRFWVMPRFYAYILIILLIIIVAAGAWFYRRYNQRRRKN